MRQASKTAKKQLSIYIDEQDFKKFDAIARSQGETRTSLYRKLTKCFVQNSTAWLEKIPEISWEELD